MLGVAPRTTLDRHLAEVHLKDCTCPHEWKGLGILYGISLGSGWVRLDDTTDCPHHGARLTPC